MRCVFVDDLDRVHPQILALACDADAAHRARAQLQQLAPDAVDAATRVSSEWVHELRSRLLICP